MPESRVILTCPACAVRYRSRREIGPRGARVTCPGCRHTFVFFPGEPPKPEQEPAHDTAPAAEAESEAITATRIPAAAEASLPDGHFASVFDRPTLAEIQLYEPDGEETEPPSTPIEDDHTSPSSPLSRQAISLLSRSRSHESSPPEPVVGLKRVPRLPTHIDPVTPDAMEASVWEAELGAPSASGRPPLKEASWRPAAPPPPAPPIGATGLSIVVVGLVLLAFFACAGLGAGAGLLSGGSAPTPVAAVQSAYPPPVPPEPPALPGPAVPDVPAPPRGEAGTAAAEMEERAEIVAPEPAEAPAMAAVAPPATKAVARPPAAKPPAKPPAAKAPPPPPPAKPAPVPPAKTPASAKPAVTTDSTSDLVDPWAR